MSIKEISSSEFESNVINSESVVFVDFYATWCVPCKTLERELENFANKNVVKVDVEKCMDIASKYGVKNIPTLIIFSNGKEVARMNGFKSKADLTKFAARYL